MTHIFRPLDSEKGKWREQANRAAMHLKHRAAQLRRLDKEFLKLGFAFNDGMITVEVSAADIESKTGPELADMLYQLVLDIAARNQ